VLFADVFFGSVAGEVLLGFIVFILVVGVYGYSKNQRSRRGKLRFSLDNSVKGLDKRLSLDKPVKDLKRRFSLRSPVKVKKKIRLDNPKRRKKPFHV
jgi:hypothetical protein